MWAPDGEEVPLDLSMPLVGTRFRIALLNMRPQLRPREQSAVASEESPAVAGNNSQISGCTRLGERLEEEEEDAEEEVPSKATTLQFGSRAKSRKKGGQGEGG